MFRASLLIFGAACLLGPSTADAQRPMHSATLRGQLMKPAQKFASAYLAGRNNYNKLRIPTPVLTKNRLRPAEHLRAVIADVKEISSPGYGKTSPAMIFAVTKYCAPRSLVPGDRISELHYATKSGVKRRWGVQSASKLNRKLNDLKERGFPVSMKVYDKNDKARMVHLFYAVE